MRNDDEYSRFIMYTVLDLPHQDIMDTKGRHIFEGQKNTYSREIRSQHTLEY